MSRVAPRASLRLLLVMLPLPLFAMSCGTSADGYHTRGFQVNGISCEHGDPLRQHDHIHVSVVDRGQTVTPPANLGIDGECVLPLHTYDTSGVVHVETATDRQFVLGDFFYIWQQPLSRDAVLSFKADDSHQLRAFVNGEAVDGDPAEIPLRGHDDIAIVYGPPFDPPAAYRFLPSEP